MKKNSRFPTRSKLILTAAGTLWLFGTTMGFGSLWRYANSPGAAGMPPKLWPASSRISRPTDRATLVMLAHPHCPCTRATIRELELLMARSHGLVKTYILFLKPTGFSDHWVKTDLWQTADTIPDVTVIEDPDGIEAARFGAATSGQAILYDAEGNLLFNGGITGSRGHSGDNAGRNAVVSLLNDKSARNQTPVFGCPLFGTSRVEEGIESCPKGN